MHLSRVEIDRASLKASLTFPKVSRCKNNCKCNLRNLIVRILALLTKLLITFKYLLFYRIDYLYVGLFCGIINSYRYYKEFNIKLVFRYFSFLLLNGLCGQVTSTSWFGVSRDNSMNFLSETVNVLFNTFTLHNCSSKLVE